MKNQILFKWGGIAALVASATFVFGMVLAVTVLAPYATGELDPAQSVAFLTDNQATLYVWYLVIYVIFGGVLVVLSLSLNARIVAGSPGLAQTATAFALIWAALMFASGMLANIGAGVVADLAAQDAAHAVPVWLSIHTVVEGLGGGNEIVGGLWVLLISWAALRAGALGKALNVFGMVVSAAGLLTVIPALGEIGGMVFGLGTIAWFAWLGIVILRARSGRAA
jgi:hypothetical protein